MLATDEVHVNGWITGLRDEANALRCETRDLARLLRFPAERVCIDCAVSRRESGRGASCRLAASITSKTQ